MIRIYPAVVKFYCGPMLFILIVFGSFSQDRKFMTFAEEPPVFSQGSEYDWLAREFKVAKVENKKSLVYYVITKAGKVVYGKCENCEFEDSVKIDKIFKVMPDYKKPAYNRKQPINFGVRMFVKK